MTNKPPIYLGLPILYSFRRCPYAVRARMAIAHAGLKVEIREVILRNKPPELLIISPKGTVPVLQLENGQVLEESLDIMHWAMSCCSPETILPETNEGQLLIKWNDGEFKYYLDRYKYADRYPEQPQAFYKQHAELFLQALEQRLQQTKFLCSYQQSLADIAIFPFIRQFSMVEPIWFSTCQYTAVSTWLKEYTMSPLFNRVMTKYTPWTSAV